MEKIVERIKELKKSRDAVILAHNYQLPEVQEVADYLGDSLELSRIAARIEAKVIVLCGVYFMAETASVLCPDKKILIPDLQAGCPLANMITAEDVRKLRASHSKAVVVGYVNTPAEVKAELDYACTSSNAIAVVNYLSNYEEIIFIPDKYLTDYVAKKTNRKLIGWKGYCPTHAKITLEDVLEQKKLHPSAKVLSHPECKADVLQVSDAVVSTSGMCKYVKDSPAREFIIATEKELIHRLTKENPGKSFFAASDLAVCPNMKRINLEKVLFSLEDLKYEVKVSPEVRKSANMAIERMLKIV
jgi:quinolinate synthase